jgi:hypothetical protein
MRLTNQNILLASLLGSKIAKKLPRFEAVQNELAKHVLPPIPFLPLQKQAKVEPPEEYEWDADYIVMPTHIPEEQQFFPVKFRKINDTQWYLLPYEPMITISGKNNIVKREVAKKRADKNFYGSIKEYWNQGDYEITITGAMYGAIETGSIEDCFPIEQFKNLKEFMLNPEGIEINCYPLNLLDITKVVIEEFSFPFTKGENVQAYEIKAVSDSYYELLIERKDV